MTANEEIARLAYALGGFALPEVVAKLSDQQLDQVINIMELTADNLKREQDKRAHAASV